MVPAEADKTDPNDFHHFQVDWKQVPPEVYKQVQAEANWTIVIKTLPPVPEEDLEVLLQAEKEKMKAEQIQLQLDIEMLKPIGPFFDQDDPLNW